MTNYTDKALSDYLEQLADCARAEHRANFSRRPVVVEFQGDPMSLRELAERTGLAHSTLTSRYRRGVRMPELIAPPDPKRTHGGRWRRHEPV